MATELFFSLHFRPVGQGLFAHGNFQENEQSIFEWVYDCGSTSVARRLRPQISAYDLHNPNDIDLLLISHFDADHVVGLEYLLRTKRPRTIIVPYLNLAQRLYFISRLQATEADYARVLLSPAVWLRGMARNADIVFVGPGGPASEPHQGDVLRTGDGEVPPVWIGTPLPPPDGDTDLADGRAYLTDGTRPYPFQGRWEFAFYNRPRPDMEAELVPRLEEIVAKLRKSKKTTADYLALIASLRHHFDTVRGLNGQALDANEVSLVVYSGPLPRDKKRCISDIDPWITPIATNPAATRITRKTWPPPCSIRANRCAVLFTGDITLDSATLYDLYRHFDKDRMDFVSYFQVPHHGSKLSYLLSPSSPFRPDFSIFSSARYHVKYDHPSDQVIEALRPYRPLFVNEFQGLTTGGYIK